MQQRLISPPQGNITTFEAAVHVECFAPKQFCQVRANKVTLVCKEKEKRKRGNVLVPFIVFSWHTTMNGAARLSHLPLAPQSSQHPISSAHRGRPCLRRPQAPPSLQPATASALVAKKNVQALQKKNKSKAFVSHEYFRCVLIESRPH